MAGSRAALRVGLIGGIVLGLAVTAQQITESADMKVLGFLITMAGLGVIGYLAARDAGDYTRWPAVRAGAVAGLIAGLLASLAVIVALLFLSMTGDYLQQLEAQVRELYTAEQLQLFAQMGATTDVLSQALVLVQILCCGAGLPLMGLLLGALGGALVPAAYRGNGAADGE